MILFAMKTIVPGDPVKIITGGKQVTPETELQIRSIMPSQKVGMQ